jgi:hypothetical protein
MAPHIAGTQSVEPYEVQADVTADQRSAFFRAFEGPHPAGAMQRRDFIQGDVAERIGEGLIHGP